MARRLWAWLTALMLLPGLTLAEAAPDTSARRPTRNITARVTLSDEGIAISGVGARAQGSTLTITADGVFELTGSLSAGQVVVDAPDMAKVELVLSGVDITAGQNAAIYCKNADKLIITLTEGTENVLTDAAGFVYADEAKREPDAALFSKCDVNIGGTGWLTVNAGFRHGVATSDDLEIEGGGFRVNAAMDAFRGKDSVTVKDGVFRITAGGDGFQASCTDNPDKGWMILGGGDYTIHANSDGIQAETDLTITGGVYAIVTDGRPAGESDSQKGLKAGKLLTVTGGMFDLDTRDDSIHTNGDLTVTGGVMTLLSYDDALHADGTVTLNGGVINVPDCYEGIEGSSVVIADGDISISAINDGVTVTGIGAQLDMTGGVVSILSGDNGVDLADGGLFIQRGGTLTAASSGKTAMTAPVGFLGEYRMLGGAFIGLGNSEDAQLPTGESTAAALLYFCKDPIAAGTTVRLLHGDEELYVCTADAQARYVIFAGSALQQGESYTLAMDEGRSVQLTLAEPVTVAAEDGVPTLRPREGQYGWYECP